MTAVAVPVFSTPSVTRLKSSDPRPTRYLYETPSMDDRRRVSLTFAEDVSRERRERLDAVVSRINRLLQLPAGWDGRDARPVTELAALRAVEWLDQLTSNGVPSSHVVPLVDGGVQLEWIAGDQSFEIEVDPSGQVGVLGVDAAGNTIVEGESPQPDGISFVADARKFLACMFNAPPSPD